MLIALDFDATYTLDPDFWDMVINIAEKRGHSVICVTMRYEYEDHQIKETIGKKCEIIFTGRKSKLHFLTKKKIKPDIWIDDNPIWIYKDG